MNLIHFQGLNCYHDCVISIANHFGVDYSAAFATLWSETDFRYDQRREAYLTKRLLANLEKLGVKIEDSSCRLQEYADINLSQFHEGEFIIIGMDAFHIPWNQFYQTFHGTHYFIAQNAKTKTLLCFDPTYNKKNERLLRSEIMARAFDICRVSMVGKKNSQIEIKDEAQEIVRTHPNTRVTLFKQIHECINGESKSIILLAKYIDAMICNRYLYRFFLERQPLFYDENHLFRNNGFFLQWKAVKNGLYKAAVGKNNESIIKDVCGYFNRLIDEETVTAKKTIRDF